MLTDGSDIIYLVGPAQHGQYEEGNPGSRIDQIAGYLFIAYMPAPSMPG